LLCAGFAFAPGAAFSQSAPAPGLEALQEQNRILQQQVQQQQSQIDELRSRLEAVEIQAPANPTRPAPAGTSSAGTIRLSAEAGLRLFSSGNDGQQPSAAFRVDDARLFVEAPVWKTGYFYSALELATRESPDDYFHLGEFYLDVEQLWSGSRDMNLSLRVGRFYIPFGEEYQFRNVMDDPLVSHSVADIWGLDQGVQIYGRLGRVQYNLAVQNGGDKATRDFDEAVAARLSLPVNAQLSLSASAMRTGKLKAANGLSEVWLADAFFRALGPAATTQTFDAELAEVDATYRWPGGRFRADAGWIRFDDDSTSANDLRHMHYYSLEAMQHLGDNLFAAARYSMTGAPDGYPLGGQGNLGKYFYNPFAPLTTKLERLSVGLGYQFRPPLVWKVEYSWESGRLLSGAKRNDEDLLSTLLGMRF
jgi:hypothetical protein